jgi:hypothetical protein
MIIATAQLSELFSITDRAVRLWSDKGCPKAGHGKWDLKVVFNWWLENIYQAEEDGEALAEAKLEYWQAKARTETVKADIAEDSVMVIKDFKDAWLWRVSEMSSGLGSLPMRLAPLVTGKTESEVRKVLDAELWTIRDKFARTGRFTPAPKKKAVKKPAKKTSKKTVKKVKK